MKSILLTVLFIFVASCESGGGGNVISNIPDGVQDVIDDVTQQPLTPEEADTQTPYVYNKSKTTCLNEALEVGYNETDTFDDCSNHSNQTIVGVNFKQLNAKGVNISGSVIKESPMSFKSIVRNEYVYDESTLFEDAKNPFTKLYDQHSIFASLERKRLVKREVILGKLEIRKTKLSQKWDKANDERKVLISRRIEKIQEKIESLQISNSTSIIRISKHEELSKRALSFAQSEPAFNNIEANNVQQLELDGKTSINVTAAKTLIPNSDEFSVSAWFSSSEVQDEARILNFNYKGSHSALIVGIEKDYVFLGYRDQDGEYIKEKFIYDYIANQHNHITVTYKNNQIEFYINSEKFLGKETTFSGFGELPTNFGSYQGKAHFFKGEIDEVSIWSKQLTALEVNELYNSAIPTKLHRHMFSTDLSFWWAMGDKIPKRYRIE